MELHETWMQSDTVRLFVYCKGCPNKLPKTKAANQQTGPASRVIKPYELCPFGNLKSLGQKPCPAKMTWTRWLEGIIARVCLIRTCWKWWAIWLGHMVLCQVIVHDPGPLIRVRPSNAHSHDSHVTWHDTQIKCWNIGYNSKYEFENADTDHGSLISWLEAMRHVTCHMSHTYGYIWWYEMICYIVSYIITYLKSYLASMTFTVL